MADNYTAEGGLGRLEPPDDKHLQKYALSLLPEPEQPKSVPVVIGINWYTAFDGPALTKKGSRWVIEDRSFLGKIRGGHAICVPSQHESDRDNWRTFYNQHDTGECAGYSASRMMSLLNREMYDPEWLYFAAQDLSGQQHDPYSGTYIRSVGEVLRTQGDKIPRMDQPILANGISAYRWAKTMDQMRAVLQSPIHDKYQAFPLLNSWGRDYPHVVWMPYNVAERVIFQEDGEAMVVTDR